MAIEFQNGQRRDNGTGFNPPNKSSSGKTTTSSNPALVTSTGGLAGSRGALLTPYVNPITGNSYIVIHDATNFDCEEDAEYDFPQLILPENAPQEGRDVTIHLMYLKYREIGVATFNLNITVYRKLTDDFYTKTIPIKIYNKNKRKNFPDFKIHTMRLGLNPVVTGERPQLSITRSANNGQFSITSITLCGNADEVPAV